MKPYRWPKGFSGNPGGSRNLSLRAAIREQYGNDAEELRRALHDFRLHAKNEQVRLKALELELGYHSGAVSQQIELSGQTVGARTVRGGSATFRRKRGPDPPSQRSAVPALCHGLRPGKGLRIRVVLQKGRQQGFEPNPINIENK